jgi:TIR domain
MQAIRVFYSYAHEDKALRDELEKYLMALKRQGLIEPWHDRDISAGKDWKHEIDTYLNRAQIILLLISKNFIHSDYCYGIELSRAIQRGKANEATIIPILLRPCDWEELSFSEYQVLPKNQQPISSRYWRNQDEAFREVAKGIREVVQQYIDRQQLIETGEMQPLSAFAKKPQSPPSTTRTRRASPSSKHPVTSFFFSRI